ncbi:MAG: hypothetical protein RMK84_00315 [Oscillochloridaceae bacterium]|nr:hypothetical protein [Chloroflexaceae bacterium]MDW8388540.1 hypothetical protein [Oscillochloridaceae bacterium]
MLTSDDPRGYIWWWEALERTGGRPYRWMRPEAAIVLPGAGGGLHVVSLLAAGSPVGTETVWETGLGTPYTLTLPPGEPRRYHLLARSARTGDLRINMRSTSFVPPGDPRELSFILYEARQRSANGPPRAPAWPVLAWLTLSLTVIFILARDLGAGRRGALALAGGAALVAAWLLAFHRLALTVVAPHLGILALSCAALAVLALLLTKPGAGAAARPVIGLMVLAFALRMGGMLHPQALFSDLGLHANNLFKVTLGMVFFTTGLPGDAGGGQQPYPPGTYLLLLPGQLVAASDATRRLLVQGGAALLDVLSISLIWALLGRAGFSRRARLLGAALYLLPTPALESFSIGEYANLGGQALALPLLAMLGLGLAGAQPSAERPLQGRARTMAALTVAVGLGLLGHSGVTLSVGALIAAAWLFAWADRLRGRTPAIALAKLTLASAIGLGAAILFFYSAPIFVEAIAERESGGGGAPLPQVLWDTLAALAGLAPPQGARVRLPPLIGPLAVAGLALLLLRRDPQAAPLRVLLAAWWAGVALSLGLLIVAGQGVRWAIFLYPALCVSAGLLLDRLGRRGRGGQAVALATLILVLAVGMGAWIVQIRDYIHT